MVYLPHLQSKKSNYWCIGIDGLDIPFVSWIRNGININLPRFFFPPSPFSFWDSRQRHRDKQPRVRPMPSPPSGSKVRGLLKNNQKIQGFSRVASLNLPAKTGSTRALGSQALGRDIFLRVRLSSATSFIWLTGLLFAACAAAYSLAPHDNAQVAAWWVLPQKRQVSPYTPED